MEIITIIEDGHCKECHAELPKGSEVVENDGLIFCFHDRAKCYDEYTARESGVSLEEYDLQI